MAAEEGRGAPGEIRVPTVKPKEVLALAPSMSRYLSEDLERIDLERQIWAVIRAAEACAFKELSVSKSLWAVNSRPTLTPPAMSSIPLN